MKSKLNRAYTGQKQVQSKKKKNQPKQFLFPAISNSWKGINSLSGVGKHYLEGNSKDFLHFPFWL